MKKEYSQFYIELSISTINYDLNEALNQYLSIHNQVFTFSILKFLKVFERKDYGLYYGQLILLTEDITMLNKKVFELQNANLKENIGYNENARLYFELFFNYTSSLSNAIDDLILIVDLLKNKSEGVQSNQAPFSNYNMICNEYKEKVKIYKSIGKKLIAVSQNTFVNQIN